MRANCYMSSYITFYLTHTHAYSITYNMDYGRITNEFVAHDDAVSCLSLAEVDGDFGGGVSTSVAGSDFGLLVSGSWDCSVK